MTIATVSDPLYRPRRTTAIQAARSHSRLVGLLRVAIPVLAAAVIAAFFVLIVINPRNATSSTEDAGALNVTHGTITMEAPHLTGFNANGQTYEVTADRAMQNTHSPGKVTLEDLTARVQMRDEGWAHFVAGGGHFDTEAQILDLNDHVTVATDKGDTGDLASARVELKGNRVSSEQPLRITFGTTRLAADSMAMSDSGKHIVFVGHVVMNLVPDGAAAATEGHR